MARSTSPEEVRSTPPLSHHFQATGKPPPFFVQTGVSEDPKPAIKDRHHTM